MTFHCSKLVRSLSLQGAYWAPCLFFAHWPSRKSVCSLIFARNERRSALLSVVLLRHLMIG